MLSRKDGLKRNVVWAKAENLEGRELLAADLVSLGPATEAGYVAPGENLSLTFDENVSAGAGNVTIFNAADDSVVEAIDVTSGQASFEGPTITLDPVADLPTDSNFYVQVDAGAIVFETETLSFEDFDGFEFDPFESGSTANATEDGFDWTESLPEGWERDNTDTPEGSPIEYFGFNIVNKDSWIAEQGNQSRTTFTKGSGGLLIGDPDAYDDGTDIDGQQFNIFVTTQEFDLAGLPEAGANFQFDHSYRHQGGDANVDVSYDGGTTWTQIFSQGGTAETPGVDSLDFANATIEVPLENPTTGTAKFRFGMLNQSNDWWWAVDNVAFEAATDNPDTFEGIADAETWTFSTQPAVEVAPQSVSFTFNQDVKLTTGVGNFDVVSADGTVVASVPANSDAVSAAGQTVTIELPDALADGDYSVTIADSIIFDTSSEASGVNLIFEDFEGLPLEFSPLFGNENVDDYVLVMSGVLNVETAGEYTFGSNSDDGQALFIDLDQDGLDTTEGSFDEIIIDDSTHGNQDRLSTCGIINASQECVGFGDVGFELEVGEYPFEYWYFERGGGSSGEFYYAPGAQEIFDPEQFAVVGDNSKGIGVTADGITATLYKASTSINNLTLSRDLVIDGTNLSFTNEAKIPTADVYNTGGTGRFTDNHQLPGFEPDEDIVHWSPIGPEGWDRTVEIIAEVAPEYHNGWTFLDKEAWINEQGGQDRTRYTLGQGTVAVIDPDAADDFIDIDADGFSGTMETPEINIEGVPANSLKLVYDNSLRWNDSMAGIVEVSYDGGENWNDLFEFGSFINEPPSDSLDLANETLELEANNPAGATTAKFRWNLLQSGNDWWWAIDNVRATAPFTGSPIPATGDGEAIEFSVGEGSDPVDPDPVDLFQFGDTNEDGTVDFSDFLALSANFGQAGGGAEGDTNGDGMIDFADFLALSANFGRDVPAQVVADAAFAALSAPTAADQVDAEIDATLKLDF